MTVKLTQFLKLLSGDFSKTRLCISVIEFFLSIVEAGFFLNYEILMVSHANLNVWTFSVKHILKLTCTEP